MSATIRFIDSVVRNIKPSDKRQIFWCDSCPGFGLRVTPSGGKTFVYKYMNGRQSRWLTIGKYPEWTIRKARAQYDRYYDQVHDYGRDPVQEIKEEIERKKNRNTVSEFIEIYLDYARIKGKVSVDVEERVFNRDIKPVIGSKPIDEVRPGDIEAIQRRIIKRAKSKSNATRSGRVAVKNTLAYTRQLFNLAKKKRLIETNPVTEIESLGSSGSRDRVLSFKEIWLFWNRIENIGIPPVTARALKFVLVTMQRSVEVRNIRYSSYKPDENVWQMEVHETKNRTMHRVPMNRYALDIIEQVRPFTRAYPYIFGATRASFIPEAPNPDLIILGETALPQAIYRSRKALGIDDFCPHDLRRTGATWITAVGLPKLYARLMLNHSDGDRDVTGEVYVQYSYDFEKRRAVEVWEFVLDQIVRCKNVKDIPTLDVLRERVREAGLV
ncbi:MAG: integrase family protein [Methylococcaceae bacterium]|nr:integrase family protein [Methylococcaceae bacterium]